jgi:hypothetical protein
VNPIRNNFAPILSHICKLTKDLDVDEYHHTGDKEENTSSIQFTIKNKDFIIDGRVCYDWTEKGRKNLFFELWWDEECYCCLYTPIQMMNMISVLMGRVKLEGDTYRQIRKLETLLPIS